MGVRADGVHVFGVVVGKDRAGEPLIQVVEAQGYSVAPPMEGGGQMLTLSDIHGVIVEQYAPGAWEDVLIDLPGIDAPVTEEV